MSTVADLPATARLQVADSNAWSGSQDQTTREESFSWLCPWSDSNAFYNAVVGTNVTFSYGNNVTITRRVPLQHPYNPALWTSKLSWKGIAGPGISVNQPFNFVLFTVSFGYPGYGISNDGGTDSGSQNTGDPPFCKTSSRSQGRSVTDTKRKYTYQQGNVSGFVLNQNVGVFFAGRSYQVTLYAIENLANWQSVVAPLDNCVNSKVITLGGYARQPGTVLFEGSGYEIDFDVAGNARWTGTVDLLCSSLPWNSVFIGGQISPITPPIYQTADLNVLYQ